MPPVDGGAWIPITVTQIPLTDPEVMGPGRGAEEWHSQWIIDIPVEGAPQSAFNDYHRYQWYQLESTMGTYTFGPIDNDLNNAISAGRKFGFGIMTTCPGCAGPGYDGAPSSYPQYLHTLMQAETPPDWMAGGGNNAPEWVPNWNSNTYLTRFEALLNALAAHLQTGSHNGVTYSDAISYVDVRGYGSFGEWHVALIADTVSAQPPGPATAATLTRIIDAHVNAFPDYPLVSLICTFDGNRYSNMGVPPSVGYHALTVTNNFGPLGWRRDNWGWTDGYIRALLDQNTIVYQGLNFGTALMARWQTSPIVGEPPSGTTGTACEFDDLPIEVSRYHATSFGNGNYGNTTSALCMHDNVRAASKAAGYRLVITGGSYRMTPSRSLGVRLSWQNLGLGPPYDGWTATYELRAAGGATVFTANTAFAPKLFLPQASPTSFDEAFQVPASVAAGTYSLVVIIRDPKGFMKPLPLAITGRQADGSYVLGSVVLP
jgi:hypothetical protein